VIATRRQDGNGGTVIGVNRILSSLLCDVRLVSEVEAIWAVVTQDKMLLARGIG
jgi:hypothetical protein